MKAILPYIVLFVGSLVMVGVTIGAIYWFSPELLGLAPAAAGVGPVARADSASVPPKAAPVVGPVYGPTLQELRGKDPLNLARDSVAALRDSLQSLTRLLAAERGRNDSLRTARGATLTAAPNDSGAVTRGKDERERKAMVKMLESMTADNVVKLLQGMSDDEVKELLLRLKTKQAAKILAALDPDRAAKLLR